ncbi:MAG: MFS transporter [Casimicrobium sp.]
MINLSPYRDLFRDRELRRIIITSIVPRLPVGMNALSLTLLVQSQTNSFAAAGSVSAAYMIAAAIQAPIVGRFIDQNGPQRVMLPLGVVHALALLCAIVAAKLVLPVIFIMTAAFVAGATFPPVSMTIRAMYRKSSMNDAQKQTAFAIEAIVMELAFTLGPLAVSLALLTGQAATAVFVSATLAAIGSFLFAHSGAMTRWGNVESGDEIKRHWLGPLKISAVRRALLLSTMFGAAIGLLEIALPAFADFVGSKAMVGWYFAALSIPSAIAGFVYGTWKISWPLNRQILCTAAWLAVGSVAMAAMNESIGFIVMCAITGLAFGPMITALSLQLGKLTPVEYSTEAFTWSMTVFLIGMGTGFIVGGALIEAQGWRSSLIASVALFVAAGLSCLAIPEVRNDGTSAAH